MFYSKISDAESGKLKKAEKEKVLKGKKDILAALDKIIPYCKKENVELPPDKPVAFCHLQLDHLLLLGCCH